MRSTLLALVVLAAGCVTHRQPGWLRSPTVKVGASEAEVARLVDDARRELQTGARTPGRAGEQHLDRAVAEAEQALYARNQLFREKLARKERPSWLFTAPEHPDLPALTVYAEALLAWAERRGIGTLLEEQDRIREAALRAVALDRTWDHGAADRILATLDATLPIGSGGDLVGAVEHFESAIAAAPNYLPTRVSYATRWAARIRDARAFRRLLEDVVAADPTAQPDAVEENRAAQAEARRLLDAG